ncbi:MAG: hypothetical protein P1U56_10725 [Saprospiraceae bacterium]|nr:hypothetical protein [Saprospiraceae bacterium]
MNKLSIVLNIFLAIVFSSTLSFADCVEECLKECRKEERKCIEKAQEKWRDCYRKCDDKYPFWGDHGYYGDWCKYACDEDFEQAVSECIFYGDLCIDVCDDEEPNQCRSGFTYDEATGNCVLTIPDGFDFVNLGGNIFVQKNCDQPQNDCCPDGFELAIEQLCSTTTFDPACQDLIDEIEEEAALDDALGDPVDWNRVEQDIEDIRNDPDCYITIIDPDCNFCTSSLISSISGDEIVSIDGNVLSISPLCQ